VQQSVILFFASQDLLVFEVQSVRNRVMVRFFTSFFLVAVTAVGGEQSQVKSGLEIEYGRYSSQEQARAAWVPVSGSSPVLLQKQGDQTALHLRCHFEGTELARGCWDRKVALDLGGCRRIEFEVFCKDPTPISYFSLYFQSGNGWYHGIFYPESQTDWNQVILDKKSFVEEGQPAGWSQISCIRLSAWRGKAQNTEFYLRNLRQTGLLGQDVAVAIVRADSLSKRDLGQSRVVEARCKFIAEALNESRVGCTVLSDLDADPARLKKARLIILPHNPELSAPMLESLRLRAGEGVKFLVLGRVPPALQEALNKSGEKAISLGKIKRPEVKTGRWTALPEDLVPGGTPQQKKRKLLLAAGQLEPLIWKEAIQSRLESVGVIGGFKDLDSAAKAIRRVKPANTKARADLKSSLVLRRQAETQLSRGKYEEAFQLAENAALTAERAWCRIQPSQTREFRAFWCHDAYGVAGMSWDEAAKRLAEAGFTAVIPNMLWGGVAYYESQILPVSSEVKTRGDAIAQCLEACRKYGLEVHVWKVNWYCSGGTPKEFLERMRREGRLQTDVAEKEEPWLCPSHPDNQKLEIDSMLEVARRYPVDGLHFDYIRYPSAEHCFCPGCRTRFESAAGQTLGQWPKDVLAGGKLRTEWLEWRRKNIATVVREVREKTRVLNPNLKISAAVWPLWPSDRDTLGQDWKAWCDAGWMDFVCPMDYMSGQRRFESTIRDQIQWAGKTPCYPGIGPSATPALKTDGVIAQIQATRKAQTGGFVIFNYGRSEAESLLPLLGLGCTAP
jgi:uncharacterized lipoprotein YddW (UPF0748 family)